MKKALLLLLLCSGLFARDICSVAMEKVSKSMDLMLLDLKSGDKYSLNVNYAEFTVWVNYGAMNCSGDNYKFLLETKEIINENLKGLIK